MGQQVPPDSNTIGGNITQGTVLSDGTTNRVLLGYQRGGFSAPGSPNFGFKISQPGQDVLQATTDELVMSSDFNMFKIVKIIPITIPGFNLNTGASTWGTNFSNITVAHGEDYIPFFVAAGTGGGGAYFPIPQIGLNLTAGNPQWSTITVVSDATNLYAEQQMLAYNLNVTVASADIKVWILRETAN